MNESYIDFVEIANTGKTLVWKVVNKQGYSLGKIGWQGPWRRYVFYPMPNTLWDANCLRDVQSFITREMEKRKRVPIMKNPPSPPPPRLIKEGNIPKQLKDD